MRTLRLTWPERRRATIVPFFIPYLGCRSRCVFCAQHTITGESGLQDPVQRLDALAAELTTRRGRGLPPPELAFYGGTFTQLPDALFSECASRAHALKESGLLCAWRCSTRPDALDDARLDVLAAMTCDTVELGIQSFSDAALSLSRRGYTGDVAREAVTRLKKAGFACGVQLLPGMPGCDPACFLSDVRTALSLGADLLRFYPCLVFSGTELARLWEKGDFVPWELSTTISALAEAYCLTVASDVPVIRMGLSLDAAGRAGCLAGPMDPALGSRVMGHALYRCVRAAVGASQVSAVYAPMSVQGFFWGSSGELKTSWASLGLKPSATHFENRCDILLFCENCA